MSQFKDVAFLQGGPSNGQRMAWRGGDLIQVEILEARPLGVAGYIAPDGPAPARRTGWYRRSMVSKHIFVWQP